MGENDYDDLRRKNIAERDAIFSEFFQDLKKQSSEINELEQKQQDIEDIENKPPRKRRRTIAGTAPDPVFNKRVKPDFYKRYNTRSRANRLRQSNSNSEDWQDDEEESNGLEHKKQRRGFFRWDKCIDTSMDDINREEDEYSEEELYSGLRKQILKVNKSAYDPNSIPKVEEITDEMLANVAEKSTLKQYNKVEGTSCHQCRQKTLDTKTVCRSGECIGVRGQFCGPCLRGRYGESAVKALKDPNWACPPCRGLCNCSICRTRSGLRPTGILAPMVQEEGYTSVLDYLQSTEVGDT